jgi:hypothetical protein
LNDITCLIADCNLRILCCGKYFVVAWRGLQELEKIAMGFRRRGFVVHVRRFRKTKNYKILSDMLKAF